MKIPVRGPGRPRKWKGPTDIITLRLPLEIIRIIDDIASETGKSRTDVIVALAKAASNVQVAKLLLRIDSLEEYTKHLEKLVSDLEEKLFKTQQENEKLLLERDALREENKTLKAELAELRKQLRMTARERRAEEFKAEIYEILDRYGKNGSIKMLELLKKLGHSSGDLKKYAKDFLEQWFVDDGKMLVSDELDLVVEKVHGLGELAWIVKRMSHSFRGGLVEVKA